MLENAVAETSEELMMGSLGQGPVLNKLAIIHVLIEIKKKRFSEGLESSASCFRFLKLVKEFRQE